MYIIIGGDGKEYGPISADDLRHWISEGRLNAQSLAKAESDAEFRPLSTFPELADAFAIHTATVTPENWRTRDYDLDIGGCVSRGWNLTIGNFGQLFVAVLIYFLIEFAFGVLGKIPFVGALFSIANLFVSGPLMAGMFYIFILTARGQPADIGKIFDGFRSNYWQLFLGYLIPALFYLACLTPFFIVYFIKIFPLLAQMQHSSSDVQAALPQIKSAFLSSLPAFLIVLIPLIYLSVNWQFTLPLIIDKKMGFWTAMKTSWKMVHKHWFAVFGLLVVIGLLNIAGALACCAGLIFTAPLGFAILICGYEIIFSESQIH